MDQQLRVFISVVEKQSFSRAAEELHMTQPAVSQYIRTFEGNLGMKLLDRTNKYVRLNKAGEIVYHHAKEIVGLYARMENLLMDLTNKVSGVLSIGSSYTFGEYVLPHVIANMKKSYPEVHPSVTIENTEKIAELVKGHQIDIGIIEGNIKEDSQLEKEDFLEDRMVIVASFNNSLTQNKGTIDLGELERQTWILREEGSGTREAGEKIFQRLGIRPTNLMVFSSTQSIKEAVIAGLGVSLLSEIAVQKELLHNNMKIIEVEGLPYTRNFSIITASPYQTKALQELIRMLKEYGLKRG
ncbi:LysR family transcriptional regulator [Ornithinibacillus bavariensis]|uniref:LysR family transcriptional regulator n=1 Tax=Ornithinibacillus bavariensis TaxID=545502 RepID=A0A919X433_9BACI|nr:LysR family transcriptional regulator [Ornithinibacillus bavariensis]GIO25491.1 LysR family transcriptional regulator [Ornithinibacillus bavariensis]